MALLDVEHLRVDLRTHRGSAPAVRDLTEDIDWPLAFVGYGPVEVWDVKTAMIEDFVPMAQASKTTP